MVYLVYFEFNRNSVIEPSNLEALDIPILATLPSVPKKDKGYHLSQIFMEDVNSEFAESIRTLRTLMIAQISEEKNHFDNINLFWRRKNNYSFEFKFGLFKNWKSSFS